MTCAICHQGETKPGYTTVTLEREERAVVMDRIPAQVCARCGEAYIDEETTRIVLASAEAMVNSGNSYRELGQLFGTIEYEPDYDYKSQRRRP